MTNIAICDDDKKLCAKIENSILKYSETSPFAIDIEVFYTGEDLYRFCKLNYEFDLIFLDIILAKMDGIELGNLMRKEMNNRKVPIVYMSATDWYAKDFSRIQPFRFFKKPLTSKDIAECLDEYFEDYGDNNLYFEFSVGKTARRVAVNSILYFESNNKKVKIKTLYGDVEFYGKLCDVQNESFAKSFLNIHKSYLVNQKQISEYHFTYIIMNNGVKLEISRNNQKAVRDRLLES